MRKGDARGETQRCVAMQDQDVEVVGGDANGDHRPLHLAAQASVGWSYRPHAYGALPSQIPHLLGPSCKAARASSVYLRAFTEQDAQAGRHIDGLQEVEGASKDRTPWRDLIYSTAKYPPEIQHEGN